MYSRTLVVRSFGRQTSSSNSYAKGDSLIDTLSAHTIPTRKSATKKLSCTVAPRNQQRKPNGSEQYTFATNSVAANVGIKIKQTANSKVRQTKPLTEPSTSHLNTVPSRLRKYINSTYKNEQGQTNKSNRLSQIINERTDQILIFFTRSMKVS
jgi:hypothetical protein